MMLEDFSAAIETMSFLDAELIRFVMPWIGLGFAAALILGLVLDVRGAIVAFALGAIAPVRVYLPPGDEDLVDIVFGLLRAPIPFDLKGTGVSFLLELTLNWWLGAAFGAALAVYARRRRT